MFDVVSVGNATMDAFVQINPKRHYRAGKKELFFRAGSKTEVENLLFFSGGSATNTAVSFARQGLRTACVCQIGNDESGHGILAELNREGINTRLVLQTTASATAFSVILTGHGLNRVIFAYGGATRKLDHAQRRIDWEKLSRTRALYLGSLHSSLALVKHLASFCERKKIFLAWNPGQSELKPGLRKLKPILQHVSVLFLNGEEAQQLAGEKDWRANARFLQRFVPLVVISLGPQGAGCFDGQKYWFERAHAAKKVDSTGAGDAFNSGFLSSVLHGDDLATALENGVANATSVIKYLGAKNRLLHRSRPKK
ncbi:MAG: carbohydrate kinase family protein [Candidatus Diapherotrites archaeon]|nr:carbohydrate kinase family protein [Candidatus Diapherotrites archaeon]